MVATSFARSTGSRRGITRMPVPTMSTSGATAAAWVRTVIGSSHGMPYSPGACSR